MGAWQLPSRRSIILLALLFPIVGYIPLNAVLWHLGLLDVFLIDFAAYYHAANRFVGGYPLYEVSSMIDGLSPNFRAGMEFLYPPATVLLFVPFVLLPLVVAGVLWNVLTLGILLVSVWLLTGSFDGAWSRKERCIICFLVASFAPTIMWLKHGQVSGLLAAFMCLSVVLVRGSTKRSAVSAGALTLFAGFFKPAYFAYGAHTVLDDRRITGAVASCVVFIIVNLLFGPRAALGYVGVLRDELREAQVASPNDWTASHFHPFGWLGVLRFVVIAVLVLGTVGISLYARRNDLPDEYILALGAVMTPLVYPAVNGLTLNALIPAFLIVASYERMLGRKVSLIVVLSAALVHIHPYTVEFLSQVVPDLHPSLGGLSSAIPFLQPAMYGVGLLLGFILWRLWKGT